MEFGSECEGGEFEEEAGGDDFGGEAEDGGEGYAGLRGGGSGLGEEGILR